MTIPRATKIVATLGPASTDSATLERLILSGVNVVRVNFSHGTAEEHIGVVGRVREIGKRLGRDIGVLADLQGPKIRIGKFADGKVTLIEGDRFTFDIDCEVGDETRVGLDYKDLVNDVKAGDTLLLNDGRMIMRADRVTERTIECTVTLGGVLSNRKGINRQGGGLSAPALTAKDMDDIKTAVGFAADFVAVSFPKNASDMYMARELCRAAGGRALMIAKIERYEAIGDAGMARVAACTKPTIAMLQGWTLGGGVAIALNCDLRIADASMRFGVPAARLGIGYRWRGIKKLVDTVGAPNAREIFLTARRFDAATALRMGFVNRLVARGELEAAVRAECELIAANAPMTMAAVKLAIDEIQRASPHLDAVRMEAATRGVFASEDFIEGRRAFMAKRPPQFNGR